MAFRECPVHRVAMELRQFEGFTAYCCPVPDCPKMKPNKWEGRMICRKKERKSENFAGKRGFARAAHAKKRSQATSFAPDVLSTPSPRPVPWVGQSLESQKIEGNENQKGFDFGPPPPLRHRDE